MRGRNLNQTLALAMILLTAACSHYSTSSVAPPAGATPTTAASKPAPKTPDQVVVTEGDITDRPYTSLGDITVTVRKFSIFNKDPTPAQVNDALREKAAEMGADAVVLARYGAVGVSVISWGELEGAGRAVVFQ